MKRHSVSGAEAVPALRGTRRCIRAGAWYEGDCTRLATQLEDLIAQHDRVAASTSNTNSGGSFDVRAVIGPHAGLSYCAPTGTAAYAALRRWLLASPTASGSNATNAASIRRLYLIGPSHSKYLRGVALASVAAYQSPFGTFALDAAGVQGVAAAAATAGVPCGFLAASEDEDEHSLELHLPYLGHLFLGGDAAIATLGLPPVSLVPLLVGDLSAAEEQAFGTHVLGPILADKSSLLIVSTDFCHWGSRFRYTHRYVPPATAAPSAAAAAPQAATTIGDSIEAMDREGIAHVERNDVAAWGEYMARTKNTICGRHALASLMHGLAAPMAASLAPRTRFLHYSQSSRCVALGDSSVSYAAGIVTTSAS